MYRTKLLVHLAKNNKTEDANITPQMSYREKVYSYLRNVEIQNKQDTDPYEFTETNNESHSQYSTENFYIERRNKCLSSETFPNSCNEHLLESGAEGINIGTNFLDESDAIDTHEKSNETYVPIINQHTEKTDSSQTLLNSVVRADKPKIHILDYRIFPAENSVMLVDNNTYCTELTEVEKCNRFVNDTTESVLKKDQGTSKPGIIREDSFQIFSDENSSGVDYIPPSYETSESSRTSEREEKLDQVSIKDSTSLTEITQTLPFEITSSQQVTSMGSKNSLKKDLCPLCYEDVDHFSRHLLRRHSDDETVKKISKMALNSKERRNAVIALRKKGNFILQEQKDSLRPVRMPNKCHNNLQKDTDYFPCVNCLGFYKKSYLWRYKKICKSQVKDGATSSRNHLTESQTFLATTGLLGNIFNSSRVKKEVFGIMRPDAVSYTAKTDSLICLFGESYINKHKRKQMSTVVSNKMRELARLKIALKRSSTIEGLIDVLKPECYELIVAATKLICGYNTEKRTYSAPSLALHMGTTLKFLCDIATKAVLTKNPLFAHIDREKKIKEIKEIRHMINMHWCNDVSSLANKVLNEEKFSKPKLLPFTEDVKALNTYVTSCAQIAYKNLSNNEDLKINYKILSECTLVLVLIFNRKRVGEVQFLNIETYENSNFSVNQEECLSSLTQLEKNMSATFKRVVVFGKGSRPVPILFTKLMQRYLQMLLHIRKCTEVVPKSNTYVFANPDSKDRWMSGPSVLRKYAYKCGAKNPELLTSTRFRKQLATILQLMNFENDEMEQIARFMGHTEKTHKEFYRLTEDVYQTAKVAKVLLLLNVGKGSEFKGKSLAEIDVAGDILECGEEEKEDSEDSDDIHEQYEEGQEPEEEDIALPKRQPSYTNGEYGAKQTKKAQVSKMNRVRWVDKEKKLVLKYFKKHIETRTAPRKYECLSFINKNSDLFCEQDWIRIKTLVFNTYRVK